MPKYFCDYCDTYLTHDSPSVRKTHNGGRKHKENVRLYYQQWMEEQAQRLVDATTKAFKEGKMAPANPMNQYVRPQGAPMSGAMIPPPPSLTTSRPGMPPAGAQLRMPPMLPGMPMIPMLGPMAMMPRGMPVPMARPPMPAPMPPR